LQNKYSLFSPFFEKITIDLDVPSGNGWLKRKLSITAPGARSKPYVKSLRIDSIKIEKPIIKHAQLIGWESDHPEVKVVFEMSDKIEEWGNEKEILESLGIPIPPEVVDNQEAFMDREDL